MFNRTRPTVVLAMVVAACSDDLPTGPKPSATPATIVIQSGDGQTGVVARSLTDPLVARVVDARGRSVRNATIWFEVVGGGGTIVAPASMLTDSGGVARAVWRLGTSTAAEHVVKAHVMTRSGAPSALEVTFRANPLPDAAWYIEIPTPTETIEPTSSFTRTVVARAYDGFRNPVPGATVRWSAPVAGTFDADETVTGPDGSAENHWTVRGLSGATLGEGVYWITVSNVRTAFPNESSSLYSVTVGEARLYAASLASGGSHSCAVADAGHVYCWGENTSGQLGDHLSVSRPFAVHVSAGTESFTQVVAGRAHTCALTTAGKVYCWGANADGQLGDGTQAFRSGAVVVEPRATFVSLVAGGDHTCGLSDSGAAYCWGSNSHGQLGDGTVTSRSAPNSVVGGERFTSLTAGVHHTCGLTTDGRTLCWGSDGNGQIGTTALGAACAFRCIPRPTLVDGSFVALGAGLEYTCGVERDGTTWCWGAGLQTRTRVPIDVPFTALVGSRASDACGITEEGRAYCWTFYYDDYYYYGDGTTELTEPQPVGGDRMFSALRLNDSAACGVERGEPGWVVCWNAPVWHANPGRPEPTYVLRAGRP